MIKYYSSVNKVHFTSRKTKGLNEAIVFEFEYNLIH